MTQTIEAPLQDNDFMLLLERSGQFSVRYSDNNKNQCGPTRETDIMDYCMKLTMSGAALDKHGFTVDNMFIQEYFHNKYKLIPEFQSCERIAIQACKDMKESIGDRLLAVECMISGFAEAKITASCKFVNH